MNPFTDEKLSEVLKDMSRLEHQVRSTQNHIEKLQRTMERIRRNLYQSSKGSLSARQVLVRRVKEIQDDKQ